MESWSGGDKMNEWLAKMSSRMGAAQQVSVGFLEGSTAGWNGPRPKAASKNLKRTEKPSRNIPGTQPAAYIAFVLEHGYPERGLPPRPFFSGMIAAKSPSWGRLIAAALKTTDYDAYNALQLCGLKLKEQLQQSINDFSGVPLKQATIDRKGFSEPLIDSHNMINSVDFRIE